MDRCAQGHKPFARRPCRVVNLKPRGHDAQPTGNSVAAAEPPTKSNSARVTVAGMAIPLNVRSWRQGISSSDWPAAKLTTLASNKAKIGMDSRNRRTAGPL